MFGRGSAPKRGWAIPNSAMTVRPADPNSPETADFDCGHEWFEETVNQTVRAGRWATNPAVTALEFMLKRKTVGYTFSVNKQLGYPDPLSSSKEHHTLVFTAGINSKYRGMTDPYPGSTETLAEVMFRVVENLPRDVVKKGIVVGRVVAVALQVYVENKHARRFYEKIGFEQVGEAFEDDNGHPTIWLRKDLP